jgi:hypothetical protein
MVQLIPIRVLRKFACPIVLLSTIHQTCSPLHNYLLWMFIICACLASFLLTPFQPINPFTLNEMVFIVCLWKIINLIKICVQSLILCDKCSKKQEMGTIVWVHYVTTNLGDSSVLSFIIKHSHYQVQKWRSLRILHTIGKGQWQLPFCYIICQGILKVIH